MRGTLPAPEGSVRHEVAASTFEPHALRLSKSVRLSDLANEYAFYNHGLIMVRGQMDVDPILDHLQRAGVPEQDWPAVVKSDSPIFRGIDRPGQAPAWDCTLEAVPIHVWPGLLAYLAGLAMFNRATGFFGRSIVRPLTVTDPHDRHVFARGRLDVTAFGLDTNIGTWDFYKSWFPAGAPYVALTVPDGHTVSLGATLVAQPSTNVPLMEVFDRGPK